MRCLVTGACGFLGSIVSDQLQSQGNIIDRLGRSTTPGVRSVDLVAGPPELPAEGYDSVFHLAGKAHVVPRTNEERQQFFDVNVQGTAHVLEALERNERLPQSFVLISTVAVYGRDVGDALTEDTPREATDPYGLSKRQAEDLVLEWGERNGVQVGVVRLPLVAGPGAPGNLGAMIEAMRRGRYAGIGNGGARRSIVNAVDVAAILPTVGSVGGTYHLTDGQHPSFAEIEGTISGVLKKSTPPRIPMAVARVGAVVGDGIVRITGRAFPLTTRSLGKMTSTLTFDDTLARERLGWAPSPVLARAAEWCSVS